MKWFGLKRGRRATARKTRGQVARLLLDMQRGKGRLREQLRSEQALWAAFAARGRQWRGQLALFVRVAADKRLRRQVEATLGELRNARERAGRTPRRGLRTALLAACSGGLVAVAAVPQVRRALRRLAGYAHQPGAPAGANGRAEEDRAQPEQAQPYPSAAPAASAHANAKAGREHPDEAHVRADQPRQETAEMQEELTQRLRVEEDPPTSAEQGTTAASTKATSKPKRGSPEPQ